MALILILLATKKHNKHEKRNGHYDFAFLVLLCDGLTYGCVGFSTTTLLARSVVEVARCKSAIALL